VGKVLASAAQASGSGTLLELAAETAVLRGMGLPLAVQQGEEGRRYAVRAAWQGGVLAGRMPCGFWGLPGEAPLSNDERATKPYDDAASLAPRELGFF